MANEYPVRRRRGFLNGHQRSVNQAYEDLIRYTIRWNPRLNTSKLADKLLETRNEWRKLATEYPEAIREKILRGKPTRKTVQKHLDKMIDRGMVERLPRGYVLTSMHLPEVSAELNRSVRKLLSNGNLEDRNITYAGDAVACYVTSDPIWSHERLKALIKLQIDTLTDSLFWLDDILKCALVEEYLQPKMYSRQDRKINNSMLRKGWGEYFGNNNLLVFSVANSPPKLLEFLTSRNGNALVTEYLENRWDKIVKSTELQRKKTKRLEKKRGCGY